MGDAQVAPSDGPVDLKKKQEDAGGRKKGDFHLRNAKTAPYADDTDLYMPKLSRKDRLDYWDKMMAQKVRRVPPSSFYSYFDKLVAGDPESTKFPSGAKLLLRIVKTSAWDYLYLFFFLLWLLIEVAVYDGLALKYLPKGLFGAASATATAAAAAGNSTGASPHPGFSSTSSNFTVAVPFDAAASAAAIGLTPQTMVVPLLLMFIVQCIPTFGIMYLMIRCNDLVRFQARGKIGGWAYCSVLVAQCIEYWFYGGRGREHLAGKCKIESAEGSGGGRFNFLRSAKTHATSDQETGPRAPVDEDVSDDENPALVEDSSDEEIVERIEKAFVAATREAEEKGEEPPTRPKEEISVLQQLKEKWEADEAMRKKRIEDERLAAEATCRDWTEWTCLVCNKYNRRPTRPVRQVDVRFGVKGAYYKRIYAIIVQSANSPQCTHCMTFANYKPPTGSAHWFKHNKNPHVAFINYPIKSTVQSGLSTRRIDIWSNTLRSFFYGVYDNVKSKMVFNDWRLRTYVNGVFPEVPRQVKPADEIYEIGEMVECRLQKSDWARAIITMSRDNHTYDIRYDPGDELRLVLEENLRLPPEKRTYAYRVEMMMVFLVLTFPLGIAIASIGLPAAVFFGPLVVSLVLFSIRVVRTIATMRKYHYAGICPTLRIATFFTLPLLLLLLAAVLPFLGGAWTPVAILFIAAKFSALPVLYVQKPNFAVFALALFVQTGAGMFLTAKYVDGQPVHPNLGIALAPFFSATLTAMYFRLSLAAVWDVQLKIRPPPNHIVDKRSMWRKLEDAIGFTF